MARARNIKPGFYTNEDLVECSFAARLLFPGLWMLADREGRIEDRPKRIKMSIFPADNVDIDELLYELESHGFIKRYTADGKKVISIPAFHEHQSPHGREQDSVLPDENGFYKINKRNKDMVTGEFVLVKSLIQIDHSEKTNSEPDQHHVSTMQAPDQHHASPPDSLIPDSLIPESKPSTLVERGSKLLNEVSANEKIEKPDANASLSRERIHSSFPEKSSQKRIDQPFQPTEAAVRLAQKHGLDVGNEADLFVAHYEATGECRADWQACFRKWLLRAGQRKAETEKHAQGPPSKKSNYQKFNALDAINGGDGYGNKREPEHGRIIDVGGGVAEEGQPIRGLIGD